MRLDEIASKKSEDIYNALCKHYNAQDICVPVELFGMILRNVAEAVGMGVEEFTKDFKRKIDDNTK